MPHPKPLPSREWLLENLRYEPDTGLFWWAKPGLGRKLNVPAGAKNYKACSGEPKEIAISISRSLYKAHRLAWLMMTGNDPGGLTVDHVNRCPFDNRWDNLRLASNSLQCFNRRNFGRSVYKGVCFEKRAGKWKAHRRVDGKQVFLGYFNTEEEAGAVAAPFFNS